ncbi:RNA polymerase sigma factor [Arthrobacter sp. SLBN-112]|uniref:RNA polymerase sigma factor n=1 Tax=Arthrobacter sp. SLBN-112 TaxID=2768452 RepID=UPI0027B0FDB0|nr:RNA polymerase sigma factor [Arthrobacter sp. SLBN-112]MDQ0798916.1 RNA polymerase sigma factor (sigma-70 family) [Arthrobacter sp. SLBN-112]
MDLLTDELLASGHDDFASLFTTVYRAFSPAVAGYLRAGGVEDPEGVTHDVFLALFPKLKSVHGGVKGLRVLIFSIAHARLVDHHRHRGRTAAPVQYDPGRDTRLSASAEDMVLDSTAEAHAMAMLEGLSEDHREVLRLRIIAELSVTEAAVIMHKSPGAVTQLQHRALGSLRKQLKVKEEAPR